MRNLRTFMLCTLMLTCFIACAPDSNGELSAVNTDAEPVLEMIDLDNSLFLIHDHETGCQYIVVSKGTTGGTAITPRVDADGLHMCINNQTTWIEDDAQAEEDYLSGNEFEGEIPEEECPDADGFPCNKPSENILE